MEEDYSIYSNEFCGIEEISSLSVDELSERIENGEKVFLLDVREREEVEICQIDGSLNIPLKDIEQHISEIPRDKEVVVYCHFGQRSLNVIQQLSKDYGFRNLVNLDGGIHEWSLEIDNTLDQY